MLKGTLIVAVVASLASSPLQAQMKDCNPASPYSDYTIFVDDFRLYDPATAPPSVKSLVNSLQTSLRNHLDALALEVRSPLRLKDCPGRFPKDDDFVQNAVEWMNNRKVVMEVWAVVREADETHYHADFNVAIIPARLLELQSADPPALFRIQHRISQARTQSDLAAVFTHRRELTAYLFIGAGLRAMRQKRYDHATADLCRGATELRQAPQTAANARLLAYAATSVKTIVGKAKSDSGYTGALKLLDRPEEACPP